MTSVVNLYAVLSSSNLMPVPRKFGTNKQINKKVLTENVRLGSISAGFSATFLFLSRVFCLVLQADSKLTNNVQDRIKGKALLRFLPADIVSVSFTCFVLI